MKEDILAAVVEVEKEIARKLADEKVRAKERIDTLRRESEAEIEGEKVRLKDALDRTLSEGKKKADTEAGKIVEDARAEAEKIAAIPDTVLFEIVRKHIIRIRP